jgi:2-phospho-L-lactate guanylyltransferase
VRGWWVVIPVKRLEKAKSRLALPDRSMLALAMALDTAAAAARTAEVRRVVVVTDDLLAGRALTALGCTVIGDRAAGLNEALREGAAWLDRRGGGGGIAALAGDLPALQPDELAGALAQVADGESGVVADHLGTGTTLYAAGAGSRFDPVFGAASLVRFLTAGARAIDLAVPGLRTDVDTAEDLTRAVRLGVGEHTAAALAATARAG